MSADPTTGRASMQMAEAQVALLTSIQRIIAPLSEEQGRDLIEHWWGEEVFGIYLDWLDEAPDAPTPPGTEQGRWPGLVVADEAKDLDFPMPEPGDGSRIIAIGSAEETR